MAKRSTVKKGPGSPMELPRWQEAVAFAARAHRNQVRKDGKTPYMSHVVRVALTVALVYGCTEEPVILAALLHDTIEDTTTDYEDIEGIFGAEVADMVAALTKNMALREEEREREYDARLAKADWRVRLVKLGDVYDNFCDVRSWPAEQQKQKAQEARHKCQRALVLAGKDPARAELRRAVEVVANLISR